MSHLILPVKTTCIKLQRSGYLEVRSSKHQLYTCLSYNYVYPLTEEAGEANHSPSLYWQYTELTIQQQFKLKKKRLTSVLALTNNIVVQQSGKS